MVIKISRDVEKKEEIIIAYFRDLSDFYQYITKNTDSEIDILFLYVDIIYINPNIELECKYDREESACNYNIYGRYSGVIIENNRRNCLRRVFYKIESVDNGESDLKEQIRYFNIASLVSLTIIIIIFIFALLFLLLVKI